MNKLNKILLVVFVLALLGTVGEIVYYFMAAQQKTPEKAQETRIQQPVSSSSSSLSVPKTEDLARLARERTMKQYMDDLEKGYISTAILSSYYKGTLLKYETLEKTQNDIYNGGLSISIKLNITTLDNTDTIVIPAATVKIMSVVSKKGTVEKPIKIGDLKKGDALEIRQDYNIMETDPSKGITAFTITKEE